ncbi:MULTISPECIES: hypothetical protein [Rhodomicrobium]|uniref:hypothetical protein n=1 Tax=Rhodomicrobium TaxID=1068 RepID=UPI000B4C0BC4|nr:MULTISPECIES: hypothetical protein [Rhodomicrobium]
MIRLALIGVAILLILIGLIILPTPIPFGAAIFLLAGCALLISVSDTAARRIRRARLEHPRLNAVFASVEKRLPGAFGRAIRRTSP